MVRTEYTWCAHSWCDSLNSSIQCLRAARVPLRDILLQFFCYFSICTTTYECLNRFEKMLISTQVHSGINLNSLLNICCVAFLLPLKCLELDSDVLHMFCTNCIQFAILSTDYESVHESSVYMFHHFIYLCISINDNSFLWFYQFFKNSYWYFVK